ATIGEDSSSYLKLGTTSTDNSGDIVLKLSLNKNSSDDYDNLTTEGNLNLTMHLEKYEDYYVKSITENVFNGTDFADVTISRLCTQLGHGTKEDLNGAEFKQLEWYAFAVKGLDTGKGYMFENKFYENGTANGTLADRWYTLYDVNVNNDLTITVNGINKSLKGHQLWFIQQYTVGGGYIKDANPNFATGKKFNADHSRTTANTYANGTYQSDIYKYLNNDQSNKCDSRTENNTFILDTGISYDKHYNSSISAASNKRIVSETAKTTNDSGTEIDVTNNFTSTFWLLNYTELGLAYNKPLGQNSYSEIVKNFSIGKTDGVEVDDAVYGAFRWLRSPDAGLYLDAHSVNCIGYFDSRNVHDSSVGVRAAFQVQI
ncbi:MAG: DUF6273 domain-containing protein, partial [Eubacteriales bacterium]|nr:DUF6273 domain-containing protein [Eubacteriales bacterium]